MRLALYTAVYPGVERFLHQWYLSVVGQVDRDFTLWVALDGLSVESACEAMGGALAANWIEAAPGDSVAQVRQRSFKQLVEECDAVVMVDSDDVLLPSRLAAARMALERSDLSGCALQLVDSEGSYLGLTMSLPEGMALEGILPRRNLFGLSNSAYRSDLLRRCLPIPDDAVLVDWFLATRAWLVGGTLAFDEEPRMQYRQHGANTTRLCGPFSSSQVVHDTALAVDHFRLVRGSLPDGSLTSRVAELESTAADVEGFQRCVVMRPERLEGYVEALNRLTTAPLWLSCVAHPALRHMWTNDKEAV